MDLLNPTINNEEYLSFTSLSPRPKFILFGDSITEQGIAVDGWHTLLASQYRRRVRGDDSSIDSAKCRDGGDGREL